jgi:hypothetical protein
MDLCKSCKNRKKLESDNGAYHCDLTGRLCHDQPRNATCVNYDRVIAKIALSLVVLTLNLLFIEGRYHV